MMCYEWLAVNLVIYKKKKNSSWALKSNRVLLIKIGPVVFTCFA